MRMPMLALLAAVMVLAPTLAQGDDGGIAFEQNLIMENDDDFVEDELDDEEDELAFEQNLIMENDDDVVDGAQVDIMEDELDDEEDDGDLAFEADLTNDNNGDLMVDAPPPPADIVDDAPPPPADIVDDAPPPPADIVVDAPPPPADIVDDEVAVDVTDDELDDEGDDDDLAFEQDLTNDTVEDDDGDTVCFKPHFQQHGIGAYPNQDAENIDDCKMICAGATACTAYEWDFADEPWLARCWIHWKAYGGIFPHSSVEHYKKVPCSV